MNKNEKNFILTIIIIFVFGMILFCYIFIKYMNKIQNEENLETRHFNITNHQQTFLIVNEANIKIDQNIKPPAYEECIFHKSLS